MFARISALSVFLAAVIGMGLVQGRLLGRWGVDESVREVAALLQKVPPRIAGWTSTDFEIPAGHLEGAGAEGYLSRRYRHPDAGSAVDILILCGRPGPISLHPPTVCFVQSGMRMLKEPSDVQFTPSGKPAAFVAAVFAAPGLSGDVQRTHWSWSPDGAHWSAPPNPRVAFASVSHLFKIYISVPLEQDIAGEIREQDDPEVDRFIEAFLAQLPASLQPK